MIDILEQAITALECEVNAAIRDHAMDLWTCNSTAQYEAAIAAAKAALSEADFFTLCMVFDAMNVIGAGG